MDVLQSSLILVMLTSQGKFLYIFGGAGPECAAQLGACNGGHGQHKHTFLILTFKATKILLKLLDWWSYLVRTLGSFWFLSLPSERSF